METASVDARSLRRIVFASVFAGGLSPLVATALLRQYRAAWPVALLLIGMGLITAISVLFTREDARRLAYPLPDAADRVVVIGCGPA